MAVLATLDDLKNWDEYRAFMKERLKQLEAGGCPVFVSKDKLEFEVQGKPWKAHAVLLDDKGQLVVQKLKKEGVLFREGTCKQQGNELMLEGIPSKLVKECQKTFVKLLLGVKAASAEVPAGDGEVEAAPAPPGGHAHAHGHDDGDRLASQQTARFTATEDPLLKQLGAELAKLGPAIKAAIHENEHCRQTLTAQVKKADACLKNKEAQALSKVIGRIRDVLKELESINRQAAHIEKMIDTAGWSSDDDRVRALVAGMNQKLIQNLPTKTRNRMMQVLQSGNFSGDDKKAIKKLYSVNYLDPAFEAKDEQARKQLVDKISKDPELKKAKKDWATMAVADRVKIMQKVADMQAEVYKIPKTTIKTFAEAPDADGSVTNGYYNHEDGRLHINTNAAASFKDFNRGLATLTHENAHRFQSKLIDDLNAGKIKPGDPYYDQAVTFKLNNNFYTEDKPEYFTQPMETHSRVTGAAVDEALQAL